MTHLTNRKIRGDKMYYVNTTTNPMNTILTLEQIRSTREITEVQKQVFETHMLEGKIETLKKLHGGELPDEVKQAITKKILNSI